jgi:hypothetical protein
MSLRNEPHHGLGYNPDATLLRMTWPSDHPGNRLEAGPQAELNLPWSGARRKRSDYAKVIPSKRNAWCAIVLGIEGVEEFCPELHRSSLPICACFMREKSTLSYGMGLTPGARVRRGERLLPLWADQQPAGFPPQRPGWRWRLGVTRRKTKQ